MVKKAIVPAKDNKKENESGSVKNKYDFTNLNTLSVVSLATAVTGFGAVAAIITGHIALAQLKRKEQGGRTLALVGMILGYVIVAFGFLGTLISLVSLVRHGFPIDFDSLDLPRGLMDSGMFGGEHGGHMGDLRDLNIDMGNLKGIEGLGIENN